MLRNIEIETEGGSLTGYIVSSEAENYKNFIKNNICDPRVSETIIKHILNLPCYDILVIKNVNVEEEFRGKGIGKQLIEEALEEANVAILVSDKYESQLNGFILNKFYENLDFLSISSTPSGDFMLFPSEIAEEIKSKINNLKDKKLIHQKIRF